MVDTRFHLSSGPAPLMALVGRASHRVALDDTRAGELMILGADELSLAGAGHIALAAHKNYLDDLMGTGAGAVIVSPALRESVPAGSIAVVAERPHEVFADILDHLYPSSTRGGLGGMKVNETAGPILEDGVLIGPNAVI